MVVFWSRIGHHVSLYSTRDRIQCYHCTLQDGSFLTIALVWPQTIRNSCRLSCAPKEFKLSSRLNIIASRHSTILRSFSLFLRELSELFVNRTPGMLEGPYYGTRSYGMSLSFCFLLFSLEKIVGCEIKSVDLSSYRQSHNTL